MSDSLYLEAAEPRYHLSLNHLGSKTGKDPLGHRRELRVVQAAWEQFLSL